jgi:hypothetical protein
VICALETRGTRGQDVGVCKIVFRAEHSGVPVHDFSRAQRKGDLQFKMGGFLNSVVTSVAPLLYVCFCDSTPAMRSVSQVFCCEGKRLGLKMRC